MSSKCLYSFIKYIIYVMYSIWFSKGCKMVIRFIHDYSWFGKKIRYKSLRESWCDVVVKIGIWDYQAAVIYSRKAANYNAIFLGLYKLQIKLLYAHSRILSRLDAEFADVFGQFHNDPGVLSIIVLLVHLVLLFEEHLFSSLRKEHDSLFSTMSSYQDYWSKMIVEVKVKYVCKLYSDIIMDLFIYSSPCI